MSQPDQQNTSATEPEEEDMGPPSLVHEFVMFLSENKKWWLIPLILMFALLGLVVFLGATPLAPLIYSFL